MRRRVLQVGVAVLLLLAAAPAARAHEGFGLSPFLGVAWDTGGGDNSPSLMAGANLTYGFTDWLGVGAGYSRIFTPGNRDLPDTNFVGLRGILSLPLGPIEPYVAAGPGYYWEVAGPHDGSGVYFDAAAGIGVNVVVVRVSGEVSYRALDDGHGYFAPGVWASIGF